MKHFYKGKKVFVTGHTGFKGSWLSQILVKWGATVKGYALEQPKPSLFHILGVEKEMESVIADIRDLEKLKKEIMQFQPDIVLHLAAQPLVRQSYVDPVNTFETNVLGTVNILEVCRYISTIRSIINVTTDKVYENKEWVWGYREDENLCGVDPYSNSKSCSELVSYSYKMCFYNQPDAPAFSTARSGNVIGGGDFSKDRIIPDCYNASKNQETIIVRNPYSIRPYQHVLDCLNGYLELAKRQYTDKTKAGSFNFGPDDESCVTTGKLVDLFCQNWKDAHWQSKPDGGPHEANFLKLDCTKAKTILGWKPLLTIEQAVKHTADWYAKYQACGDMCSVTDEQITEFFKRRSVTLSD